MGQLAESWIDVLPTNAVYPQALPSCQEVHVMNRPEDFRGPPAVSPACCAHDSASVDPSGVVRRRGRWRLVAALPAFAAGWVCAAEIAPSERVAQADAWLRLRRELAQEREAWTVRRQHTAQRIELLELEREALEERIAEGAATAERDEAQRSRGERWLQAWEDGLREADEHVGGLARQLEASPDGSSWTLSPDWPAGERLRALLARAIDLQHRHQRLWHEHRVLSGPDGRLRMEVLHLGLSQAYAVSPDDQQAGHGVWTGAEWQWVWNPEWASAIRQAIRIHRSEGPPRWIELPVALPGGRP